MENKETHNIITIQNQDHDQNQSEEEAQSLINRRSSGPQELFEFVNASSVSDHLPMSTADEIILCGKLLPFREPPQVKSPTVPANFRRRSESLSELQSSSKASVMVMRTSRSLDYQKLRRTAELAPAASPVRRRWSALPMFGTVKFPPEMELGDIKSRQARRGGVAPCGGGGGGGGASWRLLKALSCKDHTSVAVTASFCVPHV